ncbi:nuclear transport factor 2 family protein [Peterkaempfera griseoplana]|uniref:nuclear transport factor 2 family protein n=1 Tax=Peterkaempfera griseoplana TaxID=66896 RepID=UPI0006E1B09B|nr:nuclear transport factor 2 family protein [Peterkaempfera griseoplana]
MQTSHPAADPRTVFERLIRGITDGDWERLADLYAEDAVVELPFALPEPVRLEGREAVRAHFAAAAGGPLSLTVHDVTVRLTDDPEVVVAEFGYRVRTGAAGPVFQTDNVQILRVRDGLIAASRDFHNHAALAAALAGPRATPAGAAPQHR